MPKNLNFKEFEEKVDNQGLSWEMKGQFEKALKAYDSLLAEVEVFSSANQLENREKNAMIAYLLMRKASVLLQTGKVKLGEELMHQAVEQAEQSGNSLIIARAKLGVGVFYSSTSRFEDGEKLLMEALSSFSKGTDYDSKQGYGWTLLNLGGLYGKQRKWVMAGQKLNEAIKMLEDIGNWVGVASAYELKAKHNSAQGNAATAKKDIQNAISFYERQGMTDKAGVLRKDLKRMSSNFH
jgi:tetratricopeptide (TPR) repeat protein